jgi:hypothetical protein
VLIVKPLHTLAGERQAGSDHRNAWHSFGTAFGVAISSVAQRARRVRSRRTEYGTPRRPRDLESVDVGRDVKASLQSLGLAERSRQPLDGMATREEPAEGT